MKINNFRVNRWDVAEVVKQINKIVEGRNVHSIFYTAESMFSGTVEIKSDEIKNCVMKVEVPVKKEAKKSKYRGVSWDKSLCKWRARIMFNGKRISLGVYDEPEQAAKAYDEMALKYRGPNAEINFEYTETGWMIRDGEVYFSQGGAK